MAGNTRGRLKEQFEGIHRNNEWIKKHIIGALILIQEHNPKLSNAVKTLGEGYEVMDNLAQDIYGKL